MAKAMTKKTRSPAETQALASKFAAGVLRRGIARDGATVVALHGELGAGKTTFIQGFFRGLKIKRSPASPTFILMRRTRLPKRVALDSGFVDLYHVDAYRLREGDNKDIHLAELFSDPRNLVLIEWPERIAQLLPRRAIKLRFSHGPTENERVLAIPAI